MRILQIHNYYQQQGGEDIVVQEERSLLERYGHEVITFTDHNASLGVQSKLRSARDTIWSSETVKKIDDLLSKQPCDIAHIHNTFLRISPSVYYALKRHRIPVVQTLHNYRFFCVAGTLFRRGRICKLCLEARNPLPGILHACYRNSVTASAVVGIMLIAHQQLKTWEKKINAYIALSDFARRVFIQAGFDQRKLFVKPNFVGTNVHMCERRSNYGVFVGRLSPEKGLGTLLEAWKSMPEIPLKVIGDGPLMQMVQNQVREQKLNNIEILGACSLQQVLKVLGKALYLVLVSEWPEPFGRVAIEAFACGVPVIAARVGCLPELVNDGETGLLFSPEQPEELRRKVEWAFSHVSEMRRMGANARHVFEERYTADKNYPQLMHIYKRAIENAQNQRQ